jgi:type IV pilus assembly protein PilC
MPRFSFQARDSKGQLVSGAVTAPSLADASRQLRSEGKFLVHLAEGGSGLNAAAVSPELPLPEPTGRVTREDVIQFAHQMAIMIQTGVPIGEALESVAQQTPNPAFRKVTADVSRAVQNGSALSQALSAQAAVFPHVMISLIHASEASGTMGPMLERISNYLAKERATLKKVRGAMLYPVFMAMMAIGVTIFLLAFVLPRFAAIYEGKGAALPMPTQILLSSSHVLIEFWHLWLGAAVVGVGAWLWFASTPVGVVFFDHLKLSAPVIGGLFRQLYITRAMQTMGTLINAGVPVLDMIGITRRVTNNHLYQNLWDHVDEQLRHGTQLSHAIAGSPLIPPSICRMIASGEKAGRLGQVMERIAEHTEQDFDESIKRATQFIEPVMVSVMGLLIGGVAISLLLPIFSVGRVMAGN